MKTGKRTREEPADDLYGNRKSEKVIQVRFLGPPWGDMESSNVAFLLSNVVLHPGCNSAEMNNHVMLGRFCLKSKHGRPFPFISSFPGR